MFLLQIKEHIIHICPPVSPQEISIRLENVQLSFVVVVDLFDQDLSLFRCVSN